MSDDSEPGPLWEHDCSRCTFLGHYEEHDLYVCRGRQDHQSPDVIARYGPGEQCFIGLELSKTSLKKLDADEHWFRSQNYLLRVAYLMAADRGLLPWCVTDLYEPAIKQLYELSAELHTLSLDSVNDSAEREEHLIFKIAALAEVVHVQRRLIPKDEDDEFDDD